MQCVGEWAENDKHGYLRAYIEATREARRKFSESGFVDLFAGPGRVCVRERGEIFDGSPLLALAHDSAPFSRVVLCDLAQVNVDALRHRTARYGDRVEILHGDSNSRVHELVRLLPPGLNLVLVDPFGLAPLHFETLRILSQVEHLDLIVNFPTSDLRRNKDHYIDPTNEVVARALGVPGWRERLGPGDIALETASQFVDSLAGLGYTGTQNRMIPIMRAGSELYRLIFASKHPLGDRIWTSVTRHTPSGQLGFKY
ncbi:three-Cys-motif partner protein TcmP [Enhygromyxa salina]|uniref:three-Cys-motif partner protein TcmP n=1 Tax=Enhygromyxa salina TaxID=215803 RepID=UPI0006969646|nr:three-Cys-motif partner protein TcmP [Enhygromyxa salina]